MTNQSLLIGADEVKQVIGCGESKAYSIIKMFNKELSAKGYYTYPGKVSRKYFYEKLYGGDAILNGTAGGGAE